MPKGDPAGYLPNVKKSRKGGKKEKLVKKLKRKKGVDNPFAMANYMMKKHG